MENSKYDFYKKAFKGGAASVDTTTQAPVTQPETTPAPVTNEISTTNTAISTTEKTKIDFKFSSLGNLDQTLPKKAKINIDSMFIKSILGGN